MLVGCRRIDEGLRVISPLFVVPWQGQGSTTGKIGLGLSPFLKSGRRNPNNTSHPDNGNLARVDELIGLSPADGKRPGDLFDGQEQLIQASSPPFLNLLRWYHQIPSC